jgi:hypothetical protein
MPYFPCHIMLQVIGSTLLLARYVCGFNVLIPYDSGLFLGTMFKEKIRIYLTKQEIWYTDLSKLKHDEDCDSINSVYTINTNKFTSHDLLNACTLYSHEYLQTVP